MPIATHRAQRFRRVLSLLAALLAALLACPRLDLCAQTMGRQPLQYQVRDSAERLEMIVNTSRILTTEHKIPKLLVENQGVVRAQPVSPNQVQLSAVKPGFTTLTVWDEKDQEHTVDVLVYADARELENLLMTEFPEASLRVRPLAASVVISGYVPRPEMVHRIVEMAEDYYPRVINNITIGGVQQVLLHVKIMEVSRTKLRRLGFDWAFFGADGGIVQNVAGLVQEYTVGAGGGTVETNFSENVAFGIIDDQSAFFGFIDALRQYNLVKVLAEPTLVTVSGRPASFSSGGEFPVLIPQSLGTVSIEYREFGTRVDFVPIVIGNGRVRLEVRPTVSEIDPSRGVTLNNGVVPGLRTRWVDTGVEMKAGQTLALAGLIQNQVESENIGLPLLADLPWIGAGFRRVREQNNEIELLIMVTPEFVDAMEAQDVPPCGPGQLTTTPGNLDLYARGYLEVPKCCLDGHCQDCRGGGSPYALPAVPPVVSPFPRQELLPQPYPQQSAAPIIDQRAAAPPTNRLPGARIPNNQVFGPVRYDERP